MGAAILVHHSVLYNETGQAIMSFHRSDKVLRLQHSFQTSPANIRHGQIRMSTVIDLVKLFIPGIRILHQLSTVGSQHGRNLISNWTLKSCAPVVSMHHNVRVIFLQVLFV